MWSSHNCFQLATGRTELHTVSTKQQRPQTASDRPPKKNFFAFQEGQTVILISTATWIPNIIVVFITSKMKVGEM